MEPRVSGGTAAVGCLLFAAAWIALLRDRWPVLPLGRAVSALTVAASMVGCGVLHPDAA
jgi:Na+/H+ antiporter NhaD/arsenite permease-like protein